MRERMPDSSHEEMDQPDKEEGKESAQLFIRDLNELFKKKYGLSTRESELPIIELGDEVAFDENDSEGNRKPVVRLKKYGDVQNGDDIGEELSHFYRARFRPDHSEHLTDEFFGWLGRRLMYEATQTKDGSSDFFPKGPPNYKAAFLGTKRMVIDRTKNIKDKMRILETEYYKTSNEISRDNIMAEGKKLMNKREDITSHFRGYEYADTVDLKKISNWENLYAMPDKEVRRRFFTDEPDYTGL